jgi:hypothetical protein
MDFDASSEQRSPANFDNIADLLFVSPTIMGAIWTPREKSAASRSAIPGCADEHPPGFPGTVAGCWSTNCRSARAAASRPQHLPNEDGSTIKLSSRGAGREAHHLMDHHRRGTECRRPRSVALPGIRGLTPAPSGHAISNEPPALEFGYR